VNAWASSWARKQTAHLVVAHFVAVVFVSSLFLNVWTPPGARRGSKLPVMVWLYGGGFQQGASSHPEYDGKRLAAKGEGDEVVARRDICKHHVGVVLREEWLRLPRAAGTCCLPVVRGGVCLCSRRLLRAQPPKACLPRFPYFRLGCGLVIGSLLSTRNVPGAYPVGFSTYGPWPA